MNIHVISSPPKSLTEMTEAINTAAAKKGFLGRDLFVISNRQKKANPENQEAWMRELEEVSLQDAIAVADILNGFFELLSKAPKNLETHQEIMRLQEALSAYKNMTLERNCPKNLLRLIDNVQYCVKKAGKTLMQLPLDDNNFQVLLISDLDPGLYSASASPGAVTIRAARYLAQSMPVIMPYQLLCSIIHYSFSDNQAFQSESDPFLKNVRLRNIQNVCDHLADPQQWKIYRKTGSNLIAVLPPQDIDKLNLKDYQEVSFAEVRQDAILMFIGKSHSTKEIDKDEIIDVLNSTSSKHVIWAGHGGLGGRGTAMGLPLPLISDIVNQVPSVNFWDMHSCYLLGNIRKIMADVQERNALIMVNNGAICESSAPGAHDDCTRAFTWIASQAMAGLESKVQKKISKVFALENGFEAENHPHAILKDSRSITPLSYPGLSTNVSSVDKTSPLELERLYLDELIIKDPLHLTENVILLPGLAELNAPFLLHEITTPLTFADFILKAFKQQQYEGHTLFMIAKLHCADGSYEKVFYCSDLHKPVTMYCQNGNWFSFDMIKYFTKKHFQGQGNETQPCEDSVIKEQLQTALQHSSLPAESFREYGVNAEAFYAAARMVMELPKEWLDTPLSPPCKEQTPSEVASANGNDEHSTCVDCSSAEAPLYQAIAVQDREAIEGFIKGISLSSLKLALEFSIHRDLMSSFTYLLEAWDKSEQEIRQDPSHQESSAKIDAFLESDPKGLFWLAFKQPELKKAPLFELVTLKYALIRSCIIMSRLEMLKQFDSYPLGVLTVAAERGTPEIFNLIRSKQKELDSINYSKLIETAVKAENWEMVHCLDSQ